MSEKDRIAKEQFSFHLTDAEKELLAKKAKSCDMTMSSYLRNTLTYGKIIHVVYDTEAVRSLKNEINGIATNINHIACIVNSTKCFDRVEFAKLVDDYENLFEIIEERYIPL